MARQKALSPFKRTPCGSHRAPSNTGPVFPGTCAQNAGDSLPKSVNNAAAFVARTWAGSRCEEKRMKHLGLYGLAFGAAVAMSAPASAQDITIGVAGPMTGQYAAFGTQFKNGMDAAIAAINASGG